MRPLHGLVYCTHGGSGAAALLGAAAAAAAARSAASEADGRPGMFGSISIDAAEVSIVLLRAVL